MVISRLLRVVLTAIGNLAHVDLIRSKSYLSRLTQVDRCDVAGQKARRTGPARHREPVSCGPPLKEQGPPVVRGMQYFFPRTHCWFSWPRDPFHTHCRSCAAKDTEKEYVFNSASCGCGVSRDHSNSIICNACLVGNHLSKDCSREGCGSKRHGEGKYCKPCSIGNNVSKDCSMEGCGSKRHGENKYCKPCRTQNDKRTYTCFLCEVTSY